MLSEDHMRKYHHLVLRKNCLSKTKEKKKHMMKDCHIKESEKEKSYVQHIYLAKGLSESI